MPWLASYGTKKSSLEYPDISICDFLFNKSSENLDGVAYEYYGRLVTYKELKDKIKDAARGLYKLGVKKGDIITVCTPNVPQGVIMFYAINYVGAIANMVHPLSSESDIEYYLNDTKSKVVLTLDIFYDKVALASVNTNVEKIIVVSVSEDMKMMMSSLFWLTKGRKINKVPRTKNVIMWKDFIENGKTVIENVHVNKKGKDRAVILYSGGTTGNAKGVMLTNLNINAVALQAGEMTDPDGTINNSVLAILPIFHGFGLVVCIHTPLLKGWKVILVPDFKAKDYGNLCKKYKPTFIVGVPTLYEAMLKSDALSSSNSLENVKVVVSGGDKMSIDLKRRVNEFLLMHGSNAKVNEGYGLTECGSASCLNTGNFDKPDSIGFPFPDMFYKIVYTGTITEAPYGVEGEICITGPSIMRGYLNKPAETYSVLKRHSDGRVWLHTGDLGCMDKDGWIYFKQRLKRMIVTSGYNVYPDYIEKIIKFHEAVENCVVVGIDDPYRIQKIKAYIILKDGISHTEEVEKSIYAHCKKNIAKYSIPHEIEYIKDFPKTLVGKVSFKTLVNKDANIEVDPLLVKDIRESKIEKLKLREILSLKRMVEKTAKLTRRASFKAVKLEEKKEQKIKRETIRNMKKNKKH